MAMNRYDPKIVLALAVALLVHLVVLGIGERSARRGLGWWLYRPPSADAATFKPVLITPPQNDPQDIGETGGVGRSINSAPGDRPLESAFADPQQDQALMSNSPIGMSDAGSAQTLATALRGENGDGSPRAGDATSSAMPGRLFGMIDAEQASPKSDQSLVARLIHASGKAALVSPANSRDDVPPTDQPEMTNPQATGNAAPKAAARDGQTGAGSAVAGEDHGANRLTASALPKVSAQATAPPQNTSAPPSDATAPKTYQKAENQVNSGTGRSGPIDTRAGKPLPSSDFESFPVTTIASRFVAGKIIARPGRKFLPRRLPDLTLAGWDDLSRSLNPSIVLRLQIDASGNVSDVKTIHSSGSETVDLPCERAAATWWFEPLIDPKTHQPRPEVMEFTINF